MLLRHCVSLLCLATPALADNFASQVISYNQGSNPVPGFTNSGAAAGEPSRMTGAAPFDGAVTPFNPPYLTTQIVSIGVGGSLVVKFDQPITNDPLHQYGFDLLVFGNTGYTDIDWPNGHANGSLLGAGHGRIEVSPDGSIWQPISGVEADSRFPTLGFSDLTDPYSPTAGLVLSDFTRPVNPAFDASGLTFAQIADAYAGSGGGTGVDIAGSGFPSISYIRITNPVGPGAVEIDAFSRVSVPTPGAAALALLSPMASRRRRGASRS
jgi:hypothetical protein